MPLRVKRFDDLACDPDLVKIDVEGSELPVIRGMEGTLRRARPVVLMEYIANRYVLRDAMESLGYVGCAYDPVANRLHRLMADEKPLNVFFIPEERLGGPPLRSLLA